MLNGCALGCTVGDQFRTLEAVDDRGKDSLHAGNTLVGSTRRKTACAIIGEEVVRVAGHGRHCGAGAIGRDASLARPGIGPRAASCGNGLSTRGCVAGSPPIGACVKRNIRKASLIAGGLGWRNTGGLVSRALRRVQRQVGDGVDLGPVAYG